MKEGTVADKSESDALCWSLVSWHPGHIVQPEPPGDLLGQVELLKLDGHRAQETVLLL